MGYVLVGKEGFHSFYKIVYVARGGCFLQTNNIGIGVFNIFENKGVSYGFLIFFKPTDIVGEYLDRTFRWCGREVDGTISVKWHDAQQETRQGYPHEAYTEDKPEDDECDIDRDNDRKRQPGNGHGGVPLRTEVLTIGANQHHRNVHEVHAHEQIRKEGIEAVLLLSLPGGSTM
jgi:hypothetical protein